MSVVWLLLTKTPSTLLYSGLSAATVIALKFDLSFTVLTKAEEAAGWIFEGFRL